MATPTYIPLATYTVTGAADPSITFSSIPTTYRDLVLVIDGKFVTGGVAENFDVRLNGSTSSIYSAVRMTGNGSTTASGSETLTSFKVGGANNGNNFNIVMQFLDYSVTDKFKPIVARQNAAANQAFAGALVFNSTSAVTSIQVFTTNSSVIKYDIGTTFSLWGIAA